MIPWTTWVLVMTLLGGGASTAPAIHSVPGFESAEACKAAGDQWLGQVTNMQTTTYARATCLRLQRAPS